jgi:metal transporter CNNM
MAGNALDTCLAACNTDLNASCIETCLDTEGFAVESTGGSGIPLAASLSLAPVLLCLSALFSGLTLGILSLDIVSLKVIESAGDPKEREYAKQILPLRRRGNLLLCTLLLGNTLVNNAVSILLADLTSGIVGLIASVFL